MVPRKRDERINEEIRVPDVRLVDEKGGQVGITPTEGSARVRVPEGPRPGRGRRWSRSPVARVMDYSKYRYEQEQRAKQARKHQLQIDVKEIKLRPKIGIHDYETKKAHVVRFLGQRAKVKVTIMFRGRETLHPERGRDLLLRLAEDVKELGSIEQQPLLDGRTWSWFSHRLRNVGVKSDAKDEDVEGREEALQGERGGEAPPQARDEEPQPREEVVEA